MFLDRNNALESMQDIDLINRYRFPRHVILDIVSKVDEYVARPTRRVHAIPTYIQVLVTLRYVAKADFFSEVGDLHSISRSSVCRIIHNVCYAINATIDNIDFPERVCEMRSIKTDFHQIAHIPNCIGAVDGTLIPIKGVTDPEEFAYVCRKNFHALNIQAVADANMRFLHINARYPGSTHDAYVLTNSGLPDRVQSLPEGGWLLGDSGYPLRTWLLTPYQSPSNRREEKFNDSHGKTRVVVERAFGVLKARFRCLHQSGGVLPFSPIKCSRIIETCFRLHNIALKGKIPLQDRGRVVNYHQNMLFGDNAPVLANQTREQVASLL